MMKKIFIIFGTRPEAIKMAAVISELKKTYTVKVCNTGQHEEMLNPVLRFFNIVPDYSLGIMRHNQTLSQISSKILTEISKVFVKEKPDLVLVHGDTTTAMSASLAAFHLEIPIGHVEAGLRTNNIYSPFPEEMNRQVISRVAKLHFAPTDSARDNLIKENIDENDIFVTGNTSIDSLLQTVKKVQEMEYPESMLNQLTFLKEKKSSVKMILVTGHRRENIGKGFEGIFKAFLEIAKQNPSIPIVYPVHLNPNVRNMAKSILSEVDNIFLIKPVEYHFFVKLMMDSYLILTDSGGIQEEAPSLNKPVLILRNSTEREEAIKSKTALLVGSDAREILEQANLLLSDQATYISMSSSENPYGDGRAAERIHRIIKEFSL